MSAYVTWVVPSPDDLREVEWCFWLFNDVVSPALVVERYVVRERPSKRHKFRATYTYERNPMHWQSKERQRCNEEALPLTEEVKARAVDELLKQLRVVRWGEVRR